MSTSSDPSVSPTSAKTIKESKPTEVQAVSTALALLETVGRLGQATLTELGRECGLTYNHTFRLLSTLEKGGYVARDSLKRYFLGPQAYVLGQRADLSRSLVSVAAPHLDALHALSGETVLLAVRVNLERMVIDRRKAVHSLRVDWPIGSRLPLYVGGLGVCLLAFAPPEVQRQVLEGPRRAYTDKTLWERRALESELLEVRTRGVRISVDDYAVGEFAIAAPILDPQGVSSAALNIAGFSERLTVEKQGEYVQAVREAGQAISKGVYGREL